MQEEGGEAKQNKFYSFDEEDNKKITKEEEEILNDLKEKRKKQFKDDLPEVDEVKAEEKEKKPGIFERVKGEYEKRKFVSQKSKELKTKSELKQETEKLERVKEEKKLKQVKEEVRSYSKPNNQPIRERGAGRQNTNRGRAVASTSARSSSFDFFKVGTGSPLARGSGNNNPLLAGSGSPLARPTGRPNPLMAGSGNPQLRGSGRSNPLLAGSGSPLARGSRQPAQNRSIRGSKQPNFFGNGNRPKAFFGSGKKKRFF